MPNAPLIDYAPAPKPMSKVRLAVLVGAISGATILIGGTAYELLRPRRVSMPLGGIVAVPTTQWSPVPVTQPSPSVE